MPIVRIIRFHALALVLGLGTYRIGSAQFGPARVRVVRAVEGVVFPRLSLEGTALPYGRSAVGSPQDGRVREVPVSYSQSVEKGQVLVQLDTLRAEARLAAVVAEVAEARARHGELVAGEQPETLDLFRAEMAEAEAAMEEARRNRDRAADLLKRGVVPPSEMDQATSRYLTVVATRDAARARLDRALAGSREEAIAAQKAVLDRHRARLAEAEALLDERTIRAPFDGEIGEVKIEVGDWVEPGTVLIDLVDRSRVDVTVLVPENRIAEVRMGGPARVVFPGKIVREAPVVARGPQTVLKGRTIPVVVRIENPHRRFYAGMSATVEVPMGEATTGVLVPKDAILRTLGGEEQAFRVLDGKAERLEIRTGPAVGDRISVLSGIEVGDRIVVRGNERLAPGAPVEIEGADADGSAGTEGTAADSEDAEDAEDAEEAEDPEDAEGPEDRTEP